MRRQRPNSFRPLQNLQYLRQKEENLAKSTFRVFQKRRRNKESETLDNIELTPIARSIVRGSEISVHLSDAPVSE